MSFQLKEISTRAEFTSFAAALWIGYDDPPQGGFSALAPVKSTVPAAIEDLVDRYWTHSKEDPASHYFSVVDTSTPENKVLGGGSWNIYLENPYAKAPENDRGVYWWPEGSDSRKFTEGLFRQRLGPRLERHQRAHVLLNLCFTLPQYRCRGSASLIMDWGVRKADELGIDGFLESTEMGGSLYSKFGFVEIDKTEVDCATPNPSEEWMEIARQNLPMSWTNMWRPIGGKYEEGMEYPWQE